jgi:hypothetical protein
MPGYTYGMDVCLGKDRTCVIAMWQQHTKLLKQLTEKAKEIGCKLCMDNLFLSRDLFSDLTEMKFICCKAVRPNRKDCHRALLTACFLLVSRMTYMWTLRMVTARGALLPDYAMLHTRREYSLQVLLAACFMLGSCLFQTSTLKIGAVLFSEKSVVTYKTTRRGIREDSPEYGGSTFLWIISRYVSVYTALHARRPYS